MVRLVTGKHLNTSTLSTQDCAIVICSNIVNIQYFGQTRVEDKVLIRKGCIVEEVKLITGHWKDIEDAKLIGTKKFDTVNKAKEYMQRIEILEAM